MTTKYFITQYNFLRLFNGLSSKYEIQNHPYYKYDIDEFKDEDRNLLLFIRLFLENPTDISKQLFKIKNSDTFLFLIAPTSPAFHNDQDCPSLKKEYYNFQLPEGIKSFPDRTAKCRHIFKEQLQIVTNKFANFSKEEYQTALTGLVRELKTSEYFQTAFKKSGLNIDTLEVTDFMSIERRNSSSTSIKFLEQEIDSLYELFKDEYKKSAKAKGYKRPQAFRLEAVNVFRRSYREKLLKLIIDFNIEKFNPELKFDRKILNVLGFHACSNCLDYECSEEVYDENCNVYQKYRTKIEEVFELQSFGRFTPLNSRKNPLRTIDEIKAASEGAYYCLHKFKGNLQIVFKLPEGKWVYADLPKQEGVLTDLYEAFVGKRKNLSESIKGTEKKEIILLPLSEAEG